MLEIRNLSEFYEDNNKNYSSQLKSLGVFDKKNVHIDKNQKEIIGTIFLYGFSFTNTDFFRLVYYICIYKRIAAKP